MNKSVQANTIQAIQLKHEVSHTLCAAVLRIQIHLAKGLVAHVGVFFSSVLCLRLILDILSTFGGLHRVLLLLFGVCAIQ